MKSRYFSTCWFSNVNGALYCPTCHTTLPPRGSSAIQLLAALSLLIVTIWLVSTKRNAAFAGIPMLFMYITTMASTLVTAYNMWSTVLFPKGQLQTDGFALFGGVLMVGIAVLLFICAAVIAWDGWKAYRAIRGGQATAPAPAAGTAGR